VDSRGGEAHLPRLLVPGSIALLSDCIGFVTILFIDIRIIQELAITASVGVAIIILTNLILLPVLLSFTGFGKRYETSAPSASPSAGKPNPMWARSARSRGRGPAAAAILVASSACSGLGQGAGDEDRRQRGRRARAAPGGALQPGRHRHQLRAFALGIDMINVIVEARPDACTLSYPAWSWSTASAGTCQHRGRAAGDLAADGGQDRQRRLERGQHPLARAAARQRPAARRHAGLRDRLRPAQRRLQRACR
jgi:hypothetical protein